KDHVITIRVLNTTAIRRGSQISVGPTYQQGKVTLVSVRDLVVIDGDRSFEAIAVPGLVGRSQRHYFRRRQRPIVDFHFIDAALEELGTTLAAPNAKIVLVAVNVADWSSSIVGVHQRAVLVSLDHAVVVSDRDMRPLVKWSYRTRVDPSPARTAVGKRPLNCSVGRTSNLVLGFLVDDDAVVCSGGIYPGGEGRRVRQRQ